LISQHHLHFQIQFYLTISLN